jgi:hypothetical protein
MRFSGRFSLHESRSFLLNLHGRSNALKIQHILIKSRLEQPVAASVSAGSTRIPDAASLDAGDVPADHRDMQARRAA